MYRNGFDGDREAKKIVVDTLRKEYEKRGYKLIADIQEDDDYAGLDIYLTAITQERTAKAVIELKERGESAHTDCRLWIVEPDKERKLEEARKQGYKPLYCYLWNDGVMAIWDIDTWDKEYIGKLPVKRHTNGYTWEKKELVDKWGVTISTARLYRV